MARGSKADAGEESLSSLADGMSSDEHWGRISVGAHIIDVGLSVQEHDLVVVATEYVRYDMRGTGSGLKLSASPCGSDRRRSGRTEPVIT